MASESELEAVLESATGETNVCNHLEYVIQKYEKYKDKLPNTPNKQTYVEYRAKDIFKKLISDLYKEYDTDFLTDYYNVLQTDNTAAINEVTNNILSSIQQAIRRQRSAARPWREWEAVTLGAWLSGAALAGAPGAARALPALLAALGRDAINRIALMWARTASADELLELSDAAWAPPVAPELADMLLRAALRRAVPAGEARGAGELRAGELRADELRADEVQAAVEAAGGECPRRPLLRVASRVLARGRSDALLASLARAVRDASSGDSNERMQVCTSITKFQILFSTHNFIPAGGKRRKRK